MDRPIPGARTPLPHDAMTVPKSPASRHDTSAEAQLALARSAEMQQLQERQMALLAKQHILASGMHELQVAASVANGLLPLLAQLFPDSPELMQSQLKLLASKRADGIVTTTTLEFYVEDEN